MRLVALALVVMAIVTASADARAPSRLHWKQVGSSLWGPEGDARAVLWPIADGQLFVKAVGHKPRVLRVPRDCFQPGWQYQDQFTYGEGYVLFSCRRTADEAAFAVMNVVTGATTRFRVSTKYDDSALGFNELGTQWASGPSPNYHADGVTVWANWRTGEQLSTSPDKFGAHRWLDRSAPRLGRALCAPLARTPMPEDVFPTDGFYPFVVEGKWALERMRDRTVLRHCGTKRAKVIGGPAQLGGGLLSWREGGMFHVRRLSDGREWVSSIGGLHTAEATYAHVRVPGTNTYKVMRASLR